MVAKPGFGCPRLGVDARALGSVSDKLPRPALTCQTAILSDGFPQCAPCEEKRKDCILQSRGISYGDSGIFGGDGGFPVSDFTAAL